MPEVASRNHLVHAPRLLERAIRDAKIDIAQVDAFAATSGPGLASSLMIGASIAKGLAVGFGKPYLAINHLEGHLLSPFFGSEAEIEPNVSLIVSGGHTMSSWCAVVGDYQVIGRTVDDAAGEAFDKVAKMLGLGYPGGPEIETLRARRRSDAVRFAAQHAAIRRQFQLQRVENGRALFAAETARTIISRISARRFNARSSMCWSRRPSRGHASAVSIW